VKKVLVTQRVEIIHEYDERRDAVDQRWTNFLISLNILPIFVSNNLSYVEKVLTHENIDGVIFTGGGSLNKYGGNSIERDQVEKYIMNWAIKSNITVLGVCRGMQFIQDYFGVALCNIKNHVGVRHKLNLTNNLRLSPFLKQLNDVNSYHNLGSRIDHSSLLTVAKSEDDIVMAVEHSEKNIFGIMWHVERENPFKLVDQDLVSFLFN